MQRLWLDRGLSGADADRPAPAPLSLTPLQRHAMQVLVEVMDTTAVAPTLADLADELDLRSRSSAFRLLKGLEERGWIARRPNRHRAITILHRPPMPDFDVTFVLAPERAGGGPC